jgi:hypothetical protein
MPLRAFSSPFAFPVDSSTDECIKTGGERYQVPFIINP